MQVHISLETESHRLDWTLTLAQSYTSYYVSQSEQNKTQDLFYEDPSLYSLGWINME